MTDNESKVINQSYPTDLSDEQWQLLETLIPPACARGASQRFSQKEDSL